MKSVCLKMGYLQWKNEISSCTHSNCHLWGVPHFQTRRNNFKPSTWKCSSSCKWSLYPNLLEFTSMVIAIMWVNPNAINVNHPPNHHHFYRWYVYHSQSWVVYDIVLPTLKGIVFGQPQVEHSQGLGQSRLSRPACPFPTSPFPPDLSSWPLLAKLLELGKTW